MEMVTVGSMGTGHESTPLAHPRGNTGITLGELLRQARERKGLTLEKLASETKIPRRHLEALERDNLAAMPGEFYQRAEIRTYARAVGLDQKLVLAQFESSFKPVEVREPPRTTPHAPEATGNRTYLLLTLGAAVAAALIVGAMAARSASSAQLSKAPPVVYSAPQAAPPPAVTSQDTQTAPREQVVATSQAATASQGATASQPAAASQPSPRSEVTTPASIVKTDTAVAAEASPAAVAAAAEPSAAAKAALVVTTEPGGARVTVNGIGWGLSPVTIPYLPPGDKRIRVSKEGFETQERVLRIGDGQRHSLDIQLDSAP
jgi:cytoskeletal protein RodZ